MRPFPVRACVATFAAAAIAALALPASAVDPTSVLFENVRIFDGTSETLSAPSNVLVRGNLIETISTQPIEPDGAQVIHGGGRTLMPGLIDAHWHTMLAALPVTEAFDLDAGYMNLVAGHEATATLMRGFTTIRDLGGPSFGLKRAIDEGIVVGPRIYPAGAMISITGGHGDFRALADLPRVVGGPLTHLEEIGMTAIADSPDEVRLRAREQLMQGASEVKLTAGGGVSSPHSPLDVSTFTLEEMQAAVDAASNWGTYVTVHAYTPAAIQRAIAAGVKVIEHGHLMDDETARLMADKGIWLSTQPFVDDGQSEALSPDSREKKLQVIAGTDNVYRLAKKYHLKTAFGTDILFSAALTPRQGLMLTELKRWYTPAEVLRMATATNAELMALSGPRNPYPGKLGVVEEGALADLLLVDGDPLSDLDLLARPADSLLVIMKDGRLYKDALEVTPPQ